MSYELQQKDLDKYFNSMKECLVDRGYELVLAKKRKDFTLGEKAIRHIVQHSLFRALYNYILTMDQLTDDEIHEMINDFKKNCPYISVDLTKQSVQERLPIRIGRWIIGSTDYVSPTPKT